ncbi:peptidoglycan-binding domain-containing protein [Mesorhizobium sp. M0571]|uniref:peptidoglycan-binding domain-containing protein n=1 Tax=Mesorhizobium sp. M0571 TaxID=2956960 RepID=UPI0033356583
MRILRVICLVAVVAVMPVEFISAQSITVSFAVTTNDKPPVGVPAHIYRKTATMPEQLATDTDDEGKATLPEAACSADVQYRAEALARIRFPRGRVRWESCRLAGPIVFKVSSSGVSSKTEDFLSGKIPDGWVVPQDYEPVFVDLRKAIDEERWGVAAKLSSQLADRYRSAGLRNEAGTFAEIALAGTAVYATSQLPDDNALDALLKPKDPKATFETETLLSPFAKKAVADFQSSCGLPTDGIVGWQTMGCLPGGAGYTLPSVATVPFQNLVVRPNT